MIIFRDQWTGEVGSHMINIRTPRVLPNGSAAFQAASEGNVEAMKSLFIKNLASPYDVNVTSGYTLLSVSEIFYCNT